MRGVYSMVPEPFISFIYLTDPMSGTWMVRWQWEWAFTADTLQLINELW